MRSIKFWLIRRQRPRQFSYDCWGFDFSGCIPITCGFILLSDQVEPGPHFAPSLLPEKPKRDRIVATAEGRRLAKASGRAAGAHPSVSVHPAEQQRRMHTPCMHQKPNRLTPETACQHARKSAPLCQKHAREQQPARGCGAGDALSTSPGTR